MRGCKLCKSPGIVRQGVHFVVSDVATGGCLASYDVCQACMEQHSPLIIPAEAQRPGVSQVRVSYSTIGMKQCSKCDTQLIRNRNPQAPYLHRCPSCDGPEVAAD